MRKYLGLAVAMLLVGMGCPLDFGIGGRLDKAAARDTEEMMEEQGACPAGTQRRPPKKPCKDADPDPSCKPKCVADSD